MGHNDSLLQSLRGMSDPPRVLCLHSPKRRKLHSPTGRHSCHNSLLGTTFCRLYSPTYHIPTPRITPASSRPLTAMREDARKMRFAASPAALIRASLGTSKPELLEVIASILVEMICPRKGRLACASRKAAMPTGQRSAVERWRGAGMARREGRRIFVMHHA